MPTNNLGGTIAAQSLAVHVPGKKNCYREEHIDHRYDVWGGGAYVSSL